MFFLLPSAKFKEVLNLLGTIFNYDGTKTQAHFGWQNRLVQLAVGLRLKVKSKLVFW